MGELKSTRSTKMIAAAKFIIAHWTSLWSQMLSFVHLKISLAFLTGIIVAMVFIISVQVSKKEIFMGNYSYNRN